jgi:hypothetical protein
VRAVVLYVSARGRRVDDCASPQRPDIHAGRRATAWNADNGPRRRRGRRRRSPASPLARR